MAVQTAPKPITYEEWLRMPETNQPCEIVDGEIKMSPAPSRMHQRLVRRLLSLLEEHVPETRGELLPSPVDVTISPSLLKVRQPDVMVVLYREGDTKTPSSCWRRHTGMWSGPSRAGAFPQRNAKCCGRENRGLSTGREGSANFGWSAPNPKRWRC